MWRTCLMQLRGCTLAHCFEDTAQSKLYSISTRNRWNTRPTHSSCCGSTIYLFGVKIVFRHSVSPTQQLALILKMEVCRVWLFDKFLSDSRHNCQSKCTTVYIDVWVWYGSVSFVLSSGYICFWTAFGVFLLSQHKFVTLTQRPSISYSVEGSETPEEMPDNRLLSIAALRIQCLNCMPTHLPLT